MKKVFLTSDMGCSRKTNEGYVVNKINNINGIIEQIKSNLDKEDNFVFIASNPDNYEKNDNYGKIVFDSFNLSGFNFNNLSIIDNRNYSDAESIINNSDLVYLANGDEEEQMKFFENINLRYLLRDYEGVIIGHGSGSLNLAHLVIVVPESFDDSKDDYVKRGLEKTYVNIVPHFKLIVTDEFDKAIRNELLELSRRYSIYALCDGTHIYDDDNQVIVSGEAYYISNGIVEKICDKEERTLITGIRKNSL